MLQLTKARYLGFTTDTLHSGNMVLSKTEYCGKENQQWHCHENAFFAYFLKGGNKEFRKSGRPSEIQCNSGTLLFYRPGEVHCNKEYTSHCRIFHLEIDKQFFCENELDSHFISTGEINNVLVRNHFMSILREFSIRDQWSQSSLPGLVIYIFNLLKRESDLYKKEPVWKKQLERIIQDPTITMESLSTIAGKLHLHPVTLSREFPKYFGCSFGQYMRQVQMEKAVILLARKTVAISEVASYCGFSDTSNFIRGFKKLKGITPDAFRKQL